ncbi:hybrid sensor histidine kinase/response regulator [Oculatella sp. LEGE 06141]|uniref:hybrid sensor histidine kinase/response regulator n=1 Tax=Oculatella sp. LEGE 06141 TaxID=1828648 RepID=UPI0018817BBE|nr:response regulator [Oculatella sp. LEGE 06141]MBE9180030.1 hybrid sensor histidine kinase/response regulator [Oculatella sp. LEGE 06141]
MSSKGRVLIVDDMIANLEVLSETLSEAGYKVVTAIDGDRVLKRVQSHPPDLILLDVQMPGIDGFETCQQLKSNPATAGIPIIFMTALTDTESKVKGFALGAVDYITKPFQEQELLARVHTHLQLHHITKHLGQIVAEQTEELQTTLNQLRQSQLQLIQNEKMSALGNLVAGVAHEINNPLSFIAGNLQPAQAYIYDLLTLIDGYQAELLHPSPTLQRTIEEIDLDYVREDFPQLIASMKDGVNRIRHISTSLRTFSRLDSDRPIPFNVHDGIDSTLMILKHRLKANEFRPEIEIVRNYGEIPEVECYAGQLNQVFMNILSNAIDALDEVSTKRSFEEIQESPNQITLHTQTVDNQSQVQIRIRDNGIGISKDVKPKIFDHLFTTKAVGEGTGLGLAISHQIVVEKHRGTLDVESDLGQGTEFIIQIPVEA